MSFEASKHLRKLQGKDYLDVKWRLVWFREDHPDWTINTDHIDITEQQAIFKASVSANGLLLATGYGSETPKDFKDYIEKAETKAIGRALAQLGYGTQFAPELDEGDRIVDSPVERNTPQIVQDTPQPTKQTTAYSCTQCNKSMTKQEHDYCANVLKKPDMCRMCQGKAKEVSA